VMCAAVTDSCNVVMCAAVTGMVWYRVGGTKRNKMGYKKVFICAIVKLRKTTVCFVRFVRPSVASSILPSA